MKRFAKLLNKPAKEATSATLSVSEPSKSLKKTIRGGPRRWLDTATRAGKRLCQVVGTSAVSTNFARILTASSALGVQKATPQMSVGLISTTKEAPACGASKMSNPRKASSDCVSNAWSPSATSGAFKTSTMEMSMTMTMMKTMAMIAMISQMIDWINWLMVEPIVYFRYLQVKC